MYKIQTKSEARSSFETKLESSTIVDRVCEREDRAAVQVRGKIGREQETMGHNPRNRLPAHSIKES